jgi:hypothetical protein
LRAARGTIRRTSVFRTASGINRFPQIGVTYALADYIELATKICVGALFL